MLSSFRKTMLKRDSFTSKGIALSPERSGGREAGLSCSRHYLSPAQPGHQGHSSSMVMFMNMRKIMMSMIIIMMSLKILWKEKNVEESRKGSKIKIKRCCSPWNTRRKSIAKRTSLKMQSIKTILKIVLK